LALCAVAAPWLAPHSPDTTSQYDTLRFLAPSSVHPFGTDALGRDVLSRVLYGARVSLALAAASTIVALVIGTAYGTVAAFAGGRVDAVLMRALDVALSIPRVLLLLAIAAFWEGLSVTMLVVLLGLSGWFEVARLVRSEVETLLTRDFVSAARAAGASRWRLFVRELVPHLVPLLAVSATLSVAATIALEAGLSFLGLGVQPPTPSWGTIMSDGAESLSAHWWIALFPGLACVLAVFVAHALGDALSGTEPADVAVPALSGQVDA
jgi:peptide/nickel transport system permease protein